MLPTPYFEIEIPDCDCLETGNGWRGRLHARRCPRILAIALKWGAYSVYHERTGRATLPKPPDSAAAA